MKESTPTGDGSATPLFPDREPDAAQAGEPAPHFEDALERLESLVEELESGDLPLEDTIAKFEEGQRLLRSCHDLLSRAELRVKEILDRTDGSLEERPWNGDEPEGSDDGE